MTSNNTSQQSYDDIDFCLETLYNAVYSDNNLYILEPISRKDIKISNIRKNSDFDYKKILESKFKFKGYYNNRLHYIRDGIYPSMISIGFCDKKINLNNQLRPELYHMAIMYMATELIFEENFNHIEIPIMCFDIKKNELLKYLPDIDKELKNNFSIENNNDDMYIIITEHYHKTNTLEQYLDENKNTISIEQIKSILFQIYFILIKMTERFNKFRHNRLNLNSILISPKEKKTDVYKLNGETHIIKDNDLDVKLTDFDYSYHVSEYIKNDNNIIKFEGGNIENPYFDVHYITNLLYLYLDKNKKNENIYNILKLMDNFFKEIIPDKYIIKNIENYKGLDQELYNKSEEEIITPLKILKKKLFFRDFIMNNVKEPIEKLNIKDSSIKYIDSNFLNKFQNKKSNQYYSNMLKGSRKITGLEITDSSNDIVEGGARKNLGLSATSTMKSYKSKDSKKKHNKKNVVSSTSFTFTENSSRTIVNPELTSDSSYKPKKTSKSKSKHSKSKKDRMNGGKSEDKKSSSSSSSSSKSSSSSSKSSSSSDSDKMKRQTNNTNQQNLEYINYLNDYDRKSLKKLPSNYVDLAPEHMIQNMPNLDQQPVMSDMGMQMNPMMPPGMPGMPGMPEMPAMQGMPNGIPPQALAQLQTPPMPESMQKIAMQAQGIPNMGPMNSQLNVPMMNNPMAQMMGMQPPMQMGGGKKMTKYKLVTDKKFFF